MPSARELLEQADALMRKNRSRADADIPLLTDAIAIAPAASTLFAPAVLPVEARAAGPVAVAPPGAESVAMGPSANRLSTTASSTHVPSAEVPSADMSSEDVPVLTDAVDDVLADFELLREQSAARRGTMEGDPSDWLVMDTIDPATHSITGRGPDTLAVVPPMTLKAAGSAATPPPMGSQSRQQIAVEQSSPTLPVATKQAREEASHKATIPAPEESIPAAAWRSSQEDVSAAALQHAQEDVPLATAQLPEESVPAPTMQSSGESVAGTADQELWRALAEQISMQVLQRLDLFTDSGLKVQLAQRLQPIVERASAELVGEITEQVGRLVRTYVSEAIEREIAQWKRDQH
jgi:hypothetical protein